MFLKCCFVVVLFIIHRGYNQIIEAKTISQLINQQFCDQYLHLILFVSRSRKEWLFVSFAVNKESVLRFIATCDWLPQLQLAATYSTIFISIWQSWHFSMPKYGYTTWLWHLIRINAQGKTWIWIRLQGVVVSIVSLAVGVEMKYSVGIVGITAVIF